MRPPAYIQTRYLIASETRMCTMEPPSAPLARRVCFGPQQCLRLFLQAESLQRLRKLSRVANFDGTNSLRGLTEGKTAASGVADHRYGLLRIQLQTGMPRSLMRRNQECPMLRVCRSAA